MPRFIPTELAAWTNGTWAFPMTGTATGFSVDTRTLRAGEIFVALSTNKRDGHDFLEAARTAGAAGAIVSRANPSIALPQLVVPDPLRAFQQIAREHRHRFQGRVIGISGSAGKTSTKDLLARLLSAAPDCELRISECGLADPNSAIRNPQSAVLATEGNLNNHIGVPLTLTRLDARHQFAVIEAGIGGQGEMSPLADMIQPNLAIVTLVAPAHLAGLGSVDRVAAEKAVLPSRVRAAGVAIFPRQCLDFAAFRELDVRKIVVEPAEVIRPAEPPKDKVYFAITHRGDETAIALAYGPPPPLSFTMRRVSDGMGQNAALAICAALWLGVSRDDIQSRLAGWAPATLRGEWRREAGRNLYVDCYNANPASMADAIGAFNAGAPADEPRLYVLGGMEELGATAAKYHRDLGRSLALRPGDAVVAIGDHAASVREGVLQAGAQPAQVVSAAEFDEVAARIAQFRGSIFIKGSRRWRLERIMGQDAGLELKRAC